MTDQISTPAPPHDPADRLRQEAITRLRKRRELLSHFLAYATVNLVLTGIWLVTNPDGFYWPIFPLLGWGVGLALHTWDVFAPEPVTEERIRREIQRLR